MRLSEVRRAGAHHPDRTYFVRQRGRFSPAFFVQVSFAPVDELAVDPAREQYCPARTPPCAGAWECQRARVSPGRFWQRAQPPFFVLPTVPVDLQ
jgi:hypothetical protein